MQTKSTSCENTAISLQHLFVSYDKTPALLDISLEIPCGHLVGIIGPNGAGKSTLIKALLGLIPIQSGKVEILNLPLKAVRQKIAYIPQKESVDWDFPITVLNLVLMGLYGKLGLFKRPRKEHYSQAESALERVGMHAFCNRQISELSGGEQQRVFLARAYLQNADLFFSMNPLQVSIITAKKPLSTS